MRGGGNHLESYAFHLLVDSLSAKTYKRLQRFAQILNTLYPCEIFIHEIDSQIFSDCNQWGFEKKQNHTTYFRLLLARFLPKDLQMCLYLDVDMLVCCDLRELFGLDLGKRLAAVVLDSVYLKNHVIPSKNPESQDILLNPQWHFNAGFLLINLSMWRDENIETKALEFLSEYNPRFCDQDTLNVLFAGNTINLGLEWNFVVFSLYPEMRFFGESEDYDIRYSRLEHKFALENTKIVHFNTSIKPWNFLGNLKSESPYNKRIAMWWECALQTPIFATQLKGIYYLNKSKRLATNILKALRIDKCYRLLQSLLCAK